MTSVGIDIGTSTTKVVFSRLKVGRRYSVSMLPQYQITERNIVYEGPMHLTPLIGESQINLPALQQILSAEYLSAALKPEEVDTGAVIITGETAVRSNADSILHQLAGESGGFVVAQAGGDLEAVLAGKGAGAEVHSQSAAGTIVNVDIGGGTANAAYFNSGGCIGTMNFHIGGRLIMLESDGTVTKIYPAVQQWLSREGLQLRVGEQAGWPVLLEVTRRWSEMLLEVLLKGSDPQDCPLIYGHPDITATDARDSTVTELWVSGGVGALMEQAAPRNTAEIARYGDIGPLLAHAIKKAAEHYPVKLRTAPGAQRATVIGAGVHTLQLSGSTVYADPGLLPLRNIPVIRLVWPVPVQDAEQPELISAAIKAAFAQGAAKYGSAEPEEMQFAVAIPVITPCTYAVLRRIAEAVTGCSRAHKLKLCILICENDIAKALGNCIYLLSQGGQPCVCLDQISVAHGDYLDMGSPADGNYIPVAVKTLVFSSTNSRKGSDNG
ncbi:ethanolamine ammonia-lyase reactivating factor EutA [Paenibacillus borealis]|uniref:ethanolamine ammonia-lyase reactivating factor EutA n=1 Tax=Paenibacillus borealis TaxID=160799 RepID=UPI00248087B3|nr:ethanolamine ammonia-lyase reactivating factor EutA [Paenibacillus borealis]